MNVEEKQALIEWAHKWLEPARRMAQSNPNDESAQASLALYQIALATLTAQPVAWTEECEITNMEATGLYLRGFPESTQGRNIPLFIGPPTNGEHNE